MNIALYVCIGNNILLAGILVWVILNSKKREDDLLAAVMAKNVADYVIAHSDLRVTTKNKIKELKAKVKAETELNNLVEKSGDRGVPLS